MGEDKWTLVDFVRESNRIEGIHREPTVAEIEAHEAFMDVQPTVESLVALVAVLQPDACLRDSAGVPGVRVGQHIAPPSGPAIRQDLTWVLEMPDLWEQHNLYETLHPFTDGNGRSGRALWLHRKGGYAPIGFLHEWYYQTLARVRLSA